MMHHARLLGLLFALSAWTACEGGQGPAAPAERELPDGWGAIELALSAHAADGADLSGKLTITNVDDATDEIERTYAHIDTTRVLDRIPLPPGTYDVALEVDNADDLQTYYGSQDGVVVKASFTTALSLFLQPAGSIEIEAWLTDYGRVFTCEGELSTGQSAYEGLVGAQRMERAADDSYGMVYYLWALDIAASSAAGEKTYRVFTSADPTSWAILDAAGNATGGTLTSGACAFDSVQVVGGRFVAECSTRITDISHPAYGVTEVESADGVTWRKTGVKHALTDVRTHILSGYNSGYWYDQAAGCALIADNQYNLFCLAQDTYADDSGTTPLHLSGLLHAWSADGTSWSELPALTVSTDDNPTGSLQAFDFLVQKDSYDTHFVYSHHRPDRSHWRLLSAALEGSVYRIWFSDGYAGDSVVFVTESLDRQSWSRPARVDVETCGSGDMGDHWPWAAFVVGATATTPAEMHTFALGTASGSGARPILHYKSAD